MAHNDRDTAPGAALAALTVVAVRTSRHAAAAALGCD